ncbi:MAG: Gfo/Idh/MocA family protein, partial [Faecalibacillus sp.]
HKHVIVEKPFVLNKEEAKELFELAKKKQCFLMEGQKAVFLPTTRKLRDLIENDVIGKIKYIELKAGFPDRFTYDHWMYDLKMGGGALYGSATYTIEYLQFLFDNPQIEIHGTYLPCPTGSDEICNFQLILDHRILVSSTIAMSVGLKNEAVFYGEKGYIVIPNFWKSNQLDIYVNNQDVKHFYFPYNSEFVYEINHIHDCLNNSLLQSPVMNQEKTIQTVELVNQLYQQWGLK